MSFLADELERQLQAQNVSVTELASKSQMSAGQIYKWLKSEQMSIWPEQLTALSKALSSNSADHAALLRAHLLDEKFGPAADLVHVEIDTNVELHDRPRPRIKGEQALHYLAELRVESKDVNDLVIDLARCLGAKI